VCGGIAEYFEMDPTIVRLIAVLLLLLAGSALLVYLIAWLIVPEKPKEEESDHLPQESSPSENRRSNRQILAWILLVIGVLWLSQNISYAWFRFLPHPGRFVFPLLLIVVGIAMLLKER
ncbi:MAG: PspC domain-containing protein, partial [Candidatus Caldatribacteriaceae bacterium]